MGICYPTAPLPNNRLELVDEVDDVGGARQNTEERAQIIPSTPSTSSTSSNAQKTGIKDDIKTLILRHQEAAKMQSKAARADEKYKKKEKEKEDDNEDEVIVEYTMDEVAKHKQLTISYNYFERMTKIKERKNDQDKDDKDDKPKTIKKVMCANMNGIQINVGQRVLYKHGSNWCKEGMLTQIVCNNANMVIAINVDFNGKIRELHNEYIVSHIKPLNQFLYAAIKYHQYIPIDIINYIGKFIPIGWFNFILWNDHYLRLEEWVDGRIGNQWASVQIMDIIHTNKVTVRRKYSYNEIEMEWGDIMPLHSMVPLRLQNGMELFNKKWIDFKNENSFWYKAQIIDITEDKQIKVECVKNNELFEEEVDLRLNDKCFKFEPLYLFTSFQIKISVKQKILYKDGDGVYGGIINNIYIKEKLIRIHHPRFGSKYDVIIDLRNEKQRKRVQIFFKRIVEFYIYIYIGRVCCQNIVDLIEDYIPISGLDVICKNNIELKCGKYIDCRSGKWYKAEIVEIPNKNKIKVRFDKLGTTEIIDLNWQISRIKPLNTMTK